jgi:hypothetical protein
MGCVVRQGLVVDLSPLNQLLGLPQGRGPQAMLGCIADLVTAPFDWSDGRTGRGDDQGGAAIEAGGWAGR